MYRKLFLLGKIDACDLSPLDANDPLELASKDYVADGGGSEALDFDMFCDVWFQLADLHTSSVDANEYAKWIHQTINSLTKEDEEASGRRIWLTDAAMIGTLREMFVEDLEGHVKREAQRRTASTAAKPTR